MIQEALEQAAQLIEDNGLLQRCAYDVNETRYSIMAALDAASRQPGMNLETRSRLFAALFASVHDHVAQQQDELPESGFFLSIWADAPERTQDEVVEAIRGASRLP